MDRSLLLRWIDEYGWQLSEDLIAFWEQTGGGDIFETETFLRPCGSSDLDDSLEVVNQSLQSRGLRGDRCLVFHIGLAISAIRLADGRYVQLSKTDFSELAEYASLDEWYGKLVRAEYAQRYGLVGNETR